MYYDAGQTYVASALLATVLLSSAFQMIIVTVIHRHRGFGPLALELIVVLSGFKPLLDTRRMLKHGTSHKRVGAPAGTKAERTSCKLVELVFEAVPSVIIVIFTTLASGVTSYVPLLSIGVSLLTIATTSTGIYFGFDQDADGRMREPMIYGAIRDSAWHQAVTRVALYLFSFVHCALKLFAIAALLLLSKVALAVYLTVPMALYLVIKALRGDLCYWVPRSGLRIAVFSRVTTKIFVDVTGNPQFRSAPLTFSPVRVRAGAILREGRRWFCSVPLELGGASWLASVLETPCASVATCAAYFFFHEGEHKLAGNMLFGALGSLLIVWAAALLTFLLSLNREYLHTFYARETGTQYTESWFHHHLGNDRLRIDIFGFNERLFSSDLRAALLSWVHASFAAWTSESGTWFTPAVQATLPAWAIPSLLNGVDIDRAAPPAS